MALRFDSILDSATARLKTIERRWKMAIRPVQVRLRQLQAGVKQRRFVGRYVAVTGSCGKTTTTTLTALLLGQFGSAKAGLPNAGTSLLRSVRGLRAPVDFMVQETSGHEPGAIDLTTRALRVDVAVVTSVGFDHGSNYRGLPGLDIADAISLEKGKLVEAVARSGFACLNFDDPRVRSMASRTKQRVISFGLAPDADVRALNVETRWPGRLRFDVIVTGVTYRVETRFVGSMALTNILGSLAVVHGFGLDIAVAIARLAEIEPVSGRMAVHAGKDGKTYILDTEKAPLWSTELLIADVPRIGIAGLTFVLGDVSDITKGYAGGKYRNLARSLSPEVETLVLAGQAAHYGAKLKNEGLHNIVIAPTAFDVAKYLDTRPPGGVVLLKANSTSRLDLILDQVNPLGQAAAAE